MIKNCPACKEYIGDKLNYSGEGTGLTTAKAEGKGLKPIDGVVGKTYG